MHLISVHKVHTHTYANMHMHQVLQETMCKSAHTHTRAHTIFTL